MKDKHDLSTIDWVGDMWDNVQTVVEETEVKATTQNQATNCESDFRTGD